MLKTSVAAAALFAVATPVSAADDSFSTGQSKVKLQLYGKINKAMMWADDGVSSRAMIVDNDASGSRFGLIATAPVNEMVSFGAKMEYEFQSNGSNNMSLHGGQGDTALGQTNFSERVADVYVTHKTLGKLTLGQGPTASDGTAEVDLSGTGIVSNSVMLGTIGSSIQFRNESTRAIVGSVGSSFTNIDGLSRNDRIRYDSPKFGGFGLATSYISGGAADVGVTYAGQWGRIKAAAAAGYWNQSSGGGATSGLARDGAGIEGGWDGSVSLLDASGLNFTLAGGKLNRKSDAAADDAKFVWGKVGYMAKIFGAGSTNFAVDYGKTDDFNGTSTSGKSYGIGVVQNFKDIGADAYITYRNFAYDEVGVNSDDVMIIMTGLQVQF